MTPFSVLPLDSCCCNCLGSICVDSFVAVFNIYGSRLSVTEGLQLAFDPHTTGGNTEVPYQFLKLCTFCAEILQRLLHTHVEFTRLTAAGSYVEVLRQKLTTAQGQFENEEVKADISVLGSEKATRSIESENILVEPTTDHLIRSRRRVKQKHGKLVSRKQNVRQCVKYVKKIKKKARQNIEEDPLALTDDESENNEEKPRRSLRKRKKMNGSHKKETEGSDSESASNTGKSDDNTDVDFEEERSFDEEIGRGKRSRAKKRQDSEGCQTFKKMGFSIEDKEIMSTKTYKCDVCTDVSFESYKAWVLHQESVHTLDLGYGDVSAKETLVPLHSRLRPCPECGKKCKTNYEVICHMKSIHLDLRPYTCEICQKSYRTKHTYKTHVENMHTVEQRQYLCILCAAAFKTKSNLLTHEKTHMGLVNNRFECTICHSKQSNQSRLRDHMATAHSDATPFVCDQCGKAFKVLRLLNRHKKLQHYKKFIIDAICKFCGKGYAFKGKLKDHLMSVHKLSKEDARVSVGSKRSSLFRVLPNGERVFKEKPTKPKTCGFCGRTYVRREQLFTHLISVHAQTQEQAKEITGLESKRNLLPGADAGSRKRKTNAHSYSEPSMY